MDGNVHLRRDLGRCGLAVIAQYVLIDICGN